jgi:hypothetical protein
MANFISPLTFRAQTIRLGEQSGIGFAMGVGCAAGADEVSDVGEASGGLQQAFVAHLKGSGQVHYVVVQGLVHLTLLVEIR